MNFKLVLVEDNKIERHHWTQLVKDWSIQQSILITTNSFCSAEEFFQINPTKLHDILAVFLDIDLPGISGIQIAQYLRQSNIQAQIIFLTAHREYVFEGYSVDAVDFLIKPLTESSLDKCLHKLLDRYQSGLYTFRFNNTVTQIPYHEIIYFTSRNHNIEIATSKGSYTQRKKVSDVLSVLPSQFIQVHRTAIVNIHHIYKLDGHDLTLSDGSILTVSRSCYNQVKEKLFQHIV